MQKPVVTPIISTKCGKHTIVTKKLEIELMRNEQIVSRFKHKPLYTAVITGTLAMAGAATLASNSSIAASTQEQTLSLIHI